MKMKQISIVFCVFIALCSTSYGQDKSVYNSEILDLGDGKIISSTLNESGDFVIQEFKVEVEKARKYYLAVWVNGALYPNGEKLEYSVLVNDEKEEYLIRAAESHPHAIDLGEQMIDLHSGENRIAYKTKKPYCPNVEFIKVSQDGDYFVINALEDLTLEENQDVLEKVKKENRLKSTSETGAAIIRSPRTIAMKYIKELLKSSCNVNSIDDEGDITYSNSIEFNVYPNPVDATSQLSFDLPTDAKVSAQVIDLNGRVLSVVINEQVLNSGNQNFSLNVPENFKGTCLVKLLINNNVNVQLVVVQ